MVKNEKPSEVCLDPYKPIAQTYNWLPNEEVTELDVSPSLYQMITSATVGSMPGNSNAYKYPDIGDDDEAHDHPDYSKLDSLDLAERDNYVNEFLNNPNNYEKKEEQPKVEDEPKGEEKPSE